MHPEASPTRRSRKRYGVFSLLGVAFVSLLVASVFGPNSASNQASAAASVETDDQSLAGNAKVCGKPSKKKAKKISAAKLIVEYQSTDGDLGVHGLFDDAGWSKLCVWDPEGRRVLAVKPQTQLKKLTMASIFFESREPLLDEFSFADLKKLFPEGRYQVRGVTFDGKRLTGSARFTHDIPAPPIITSPADESVVPVRDLVVEWQDVTETVDGDPVTITGYEVIVTNEDVSDRHGFSKPIYDVHVPADRNSLTIPAEFLEPDTEYELEVLALEKSGNQTISVHFFNTQ